MIPAAFEYQKAKSVDDALSALSNGEAKLLAGGYSLVPAMKFRLSRPSRLIDIAAIEGLKGIEEQDGQVIIRSGTTHNEIYNNDIIRKHLPFFIQAAGTIGDVQVRNRGTIGGSIAHADPAADWPALVLAADATIEVRSVKANRNIKATDFFTGLFSTQLQNDEIITAIRINIPGSGARSVYLSFEQPASRFAIVGCAVLRYSDGKINIAFTGVADTPFRDTSGEQVLSGKELNSENIEQALNVSLKDVNILGDQFASAEYRKHLAKVYLRKSLEAVA